MENITLKEKEQEIGLHLICKCKIPYKHEGLINCTCTKFKYRCRICVPGSKTIKRVLQATNITDAKIEINTIKKNIENGTYVKLQRINGRC
jgi:hypothetical protein